jgi:membrane dipeptidase
MSVAGQDDAAEETPAALAARLGVSEAAVALTRRVEVVDLHLDTFIPMRLFGYDPMRRHGQGILRGRHFGHLDLPRMRDAGLSGGMWSITTNPLRTAAGRWQAFLENVARLRAWVEASEGALALVRTHAEYVAARARGAHAVLLAVQGGNAFDGAPGGPADAPDRLLTRVTLVHLTNSTLGAASTPVSYLRRRRGLSDAGRRLVAQLNAERVFVDLAHVHPEGFWDAVEVHDKSQPLIDTHTGVSGVTPHWRNLDDRQLKAIADTGGVVGIIYSVHFLKGAHGHRDGQMILEHMQHAIDVVGEDFVAIGSDYDGAIIPPPDLRSGDSYPRLVQYMLQRGWSEGRIEKILGLNFLRAFAMLRP